MNLAGTPSEWLNLIDTLVPDILDLVTVTWTGMPPLASDVREDPTTETLCRLLRQNRNSSNLPFQIHIQMVELDPAAGQDQGRMDIAFSPLVPRENIYFCLECKRLNVVNGRRVRTYSTEYVVHGLTRFVSGQYSAAVRHGGMLGYVLNGNVMLAIESVRKIVRRRHLALGMSAPGAMQKSSIRPNDSTIKETLHSRQNGAQPIQIHHIFVSGVGAATKAPKRAAKQTVKPGETSHSTGASVDHA